MGPDTACTLLKPMSTSYLATSSTVLRSSPRDAVGVALCVSAASMMLASVVLQVKSIPGMSQN